MYLHIQKRRRRRGLGELGPDPGGEAPEPMDCLSGAGPLAPGQSYCEGNDKTMRALREFWESSNEPVKVSTNLQKYLVPVGIGLAALVFFSVARGR